MSDVIPRKVVFEGKGGPGMPAIRIVMERSQKAAAIFKKDSDRNRWYRTAWQGVGEYFIDELLPLRWIPDYARKKLRYLIGGARPFYQSGRLQALALSGANAVARATSTRQHVTVFIPTPSYVNYNPQVREGLTRIATAEVPTLAKVLDRELLVGAGEATTTIAKRGPTAGMASARFAGLDDTDAGKMRRATRRGQINKQLGIRTSTRRAKALKRLAPIIPQAQAEHDAHSQAAAAGRARS